MLVAGHGEAPPIPPAGGGGGKSACTVLAAVLASLFVAMLQELKLFIVNNPRVMRVVRHADTTARLCLASISALFFKV